MQKLELAVAGRTVLLDDFRAGDVGRHQIGRELDAIESQAERIGQRADHQRFCQTGNAHQQAVAAAEHRDQELFDNIALAHDHAGQLGRNTLIRVSHAADGVDIGHG